tara:strand:- start:1404 stop:1748 length:345 start_codon:yes stop_codon:yes gene_type:complete
MISKIKDSIDIEVYYNDTCPICKREIEIYKSKSNGILYKDSSLMDDKFNRRMHAYKNGQEFVGASAFILIWKNTDSFKWLAYFLDNKICIFLMNLIYEPLAYSLYKMHLKRKKN